MLDQNYSRLARQTLTLLILFVSALWSSTPLIAAPLQANQFSYLLRYAEAGDPQINIQITPQTPVSSPASFVVPRSYPGGYSFVRYDDFIEDIRAFSSDEKPLECTKDPDGPRWTIGAKGQNIVRIEYRVDIKKMDDQIRDSVESSKVRDGYLMILGYSVFGYIDGLEESPVTLEVTAPRGWPVLNTLDPHPGTQKESTRAKAANFDILADSQVVMGPALQFRRLAGKINLIVASYSEVDEDLDTESRMAREALDLVQEYFGDVPFPTYTALLELLKPREGHNYGFSQEHDSSGTFSFSIESATNAHSPPNHRSSATFNYAHHMAHCWIPKRVWGAGYKPYNWELTPIIETIWFNEGFGRYAAMQALALGMTKEGGQALRSRSINRSRAVLDSAPDFIRRMALPRLSQEASFLYGDDFRTGMNIFSRGFLIASEMDDRIQSQTGGQKSMRDAYRTLLKWSAQNQRAFQVNELTQIIAESTGVNVDDIMSRWMKPLSL